MAPYFSSAVEYITVFSPSPFWRSVARAEATSLADEQRVWFGLLRVVHLAALFQFSAKRKEKKSLTRTTEEPLDSGNYKMFNTLIAQLIHIVSMFASAQKIIFAEGGGSVGVFWFWLAAQQVLYGGAWIYFSSLLVSQANQSRISHLEASHESHSSTNGLIWVDGYPLYRLHVRICFNNVDVANEALNSVCLC